jgi:putative transposase
MCEIHLPCDLPPKKLNQGKLAFSRNLNGRAGMKMSRYTEEQIIGMLKHHEAGVKTADVCRERGISDATFYNWKSKYGGLDVSEATSAADGKWEPALEAVGRWPESRSWGFEGHHPKKRLELAGLREDIALVSAGFHVSERKACELLGVDRASYRYEPRPDRNAELREELVKLATQKPRYDYWRLHAVLERRGDTVNVKRVYRLYAEQGLAVRRPKRLVRKQLIEPRLIRANQEWAMDFIMDGLANGRMIRILSVVDAFTRECLVLEADTSLSCGRVTRALDRLIEHARPAGKRALRQWTRVHLATHAGLGGRMQDQLDSHPARKADAERHVGSFHGRLRDECLNANWSVRSMICGEPSTTGVRNTTANDPIAHSHTEHLVSSTGPVLSANCRPIRPLTRDQVRAQIIRFPLASQHTRKAL